MNHPILYPISQYSGRVAAPESALSEIIVTGLGNGMLHPLRRLNSNSSSRQIDSLASENTDTPYGNASANLARSDSHLKRWCEKYCGSVECTRCLLATKRKV